LVFFKNFDGVAVFYADNFEVILGFLVAAEKQ